MTSLIRQSLTLILMKQQMIPLKLSLKQMIRSYCVAFAEPANEATTAQITAMMAITATPIKIFGIIWRVLSAAVSSTFCASPRERRYLRQREHH